MEEPYKSDLESIARSLKDIANQSGQPNISKLKILSLRLSNIINSLNTSKIEIHGITIPKKGEHPLKVYHKEIRRQEVPKIPGTKASKQLLAPIGETQITINQNNEIEHMRVQSVIFIKEKFKVSHKEIKLSYGFGFNNSGQKQLNIYISFKASNTSEGSNSENGHDWYYFYYIDIYFEGKTIEMKPSGSIEIENIKTAQLFLIKEDPRTSRGTTTTVQTHNSDSNLSILSNLVSVFKHIKND